MFHFHLIWSSWQVINLNYCILFPLSKLKKCCLLMLLLFIYPTRNIKNSMIQSSLWPWLLAPCSTWLAANSGTFCRAEFTRWFLNLLCLPSSRATCSWSTEDTSTETLNICSWWRLRVVCKMETMTVKFFSSTFHISNYISNYIFYMRRFYVFSCFPMWTLSDQWRVWFFYHKRAM